MKDLFLKRNISLALFLLVNFLFTYKYLERFTTWAPLLTIIISLLYIFLYRNTKLLKFITKKIEISFIVAFIIMCLLIWKKIPIETLNVDRWSVITSFWDSYFTNKYAYFAKSFAGNPPGPMPFYFILALPFYLVSELGFLSIIGVLLFYWLMWYKKVNSITRIFILLLILSSFFNLWEVICRSNIFFNASLVLGSLIYILNQKIFTHKTLVISGIFIGLLISTRNIFVISYIICFLYLWRTKAIQFKQLAFLGIISLLIFSLTFIPVVYGHFEDFKQMNPFIVQSTFLIPFEYTILFVLIAIGTSFLCKNRNDVYFYNAVVLFISIFIYLIYYIFLQGFTQAFTESTVDISYFIFCIPFALWFLLIDKVNLNPLRNSID
ncbi:hypothetical protein [Paenimyroides viscosum]|uniref:Glycosyltransferase RgtA/B/C/D-like domain-containing protein n=1 Tax=Paenimyroides viscosum TaxID=2488729 RepID=A0A3P1B6I3_9FLAO|nr:hypothetical protein [Paenimyroides viscosum]RRA96740.1 hypothetical protein EG242_01510 [Paenimyroides viscosum]